MAWSVPIWKIYGFPKVNLYLKRFVLKHATAHIQTRYPQAKKNRNYINNLSEKRHRANSTFIFSQG
jgi:hypothetical protein